MTDRLRRITRTNLGSALLVACLMGVPAAAQDSSGVAMVVPEGEARTCCVAHVRKSWEATHESAGRPGAPAQLHTELEGADVHVQLVVDA